VKGRADAGRLADKHSAKRGRLNGQDDSRRSPLPKARGEGTRGPISDGLILSDSSMGKKEKRSR